MCDCLFLNSELSMPAVVVGTPCLLICSMDVILKLCCAYLLYLMQV
jgi:hypothetical protein